MSPVFASIREPTTLELTSGIFGRSPGPSWQPSRLPTRRLPDGSRQASPHLCRLLRTPPTSSRIMRPLGGTHLTHNSLPPPVLIHRPCTPLPLALTDPMVFTSTEPAAGSRLKVSIPRTTGSTFF